MPSKIEAECPCCKKKVRGKDALEEHFGWRRVNNNRTIPQSYCRKCRAAKCKKGKPNH